MGKFIGDGSQLTGIGGNPRLEWSGSLTFVNMSNISNPGPGFYIVVGYDSTTNVDYCMPVHVLSTTDEKVSAGSTFVDTDYIHSSWLSATLDPEFIIQRRLSDGTYDGYVTISEIYKV